MVRQLRIASLINSAYAVSRVDGDKLAQQIRDALRQGEMITLDFTGLEIVTSAFLNGAIGALYEEFTPELISSLLQLENLSSFQQGLVERVRENAIEYFRNPEAAEAAWRAAQEEAA
ncbi:MAG: hypothetical protein GEEBNDBF_02649 [bacterium]|nr:hypothetical protein [bacterium]